MKAAYLENADLEAAILAGDRERLAGMLLLLAERVVLAWGALLPPGVDRDDVVQDGVLAALRRLGRWDQTRGPAFAYCTQSIRLTVREHRKAALRRAAGVGLNNPRSGSGRRSGSRRRAIVATAP